MNIIKIELLKIFKSKSIYIGIVLSFLSGLAITYVAYKNPGVFEFRNSQAFYSSYFMEILLIYIVVNTIYNEYNQGTIKLIFNTETGLNDIFIKKLIALILLGIILAFINILFNIIVYFILKPNINLLIFSLKEIFIYCIFTFSIYSMTVFVYSFNKHIISSLMTLIFLYYLSNGFIDVIAEKLNINKSILDLVPFYSLCSGLRGFYFNFNMIIGALILGIITLIWGLSINAKQDII
ncbi:MAG: ABC transporter permease [Paraclostridium sordellii]